jgi:AcrR family transcriptional regulator
MSKGDRTRKEILDKAFHLAGNVGLEGLSLGALAAETGLSKSGLFAHFKSKEALQLEVVRDIKERFSHSVIRPVLGLPRGEPRVRAFFERYLDWITHSKPNGGCIYMALAHEYDDRPGPVKDSLTEGQAEWQQTVHRMVNGAKSEGHFHADLDPEQFVFEIVGIEMAYHHKLKSVPSPNALGMARKAFESLIERSRAKQDLV